MASLAAPHYQPMPTLWLPTSSSTNAHPMTTRLKNSIVKSNSKYGPTTTFSGDTIPTTIALDVKNSLWLQVVHDDARASKTNIGNSSFIMENSNSKGCETLERPNLFLNRSIVSLFTILIWSCFIIETFVLQVQIVVSLFNLESSFS